MSSGSFHPARLALTASLVPPFASLRFPFWKSLLSQVHTPSEASIASRTKAKLPECPAKCQVSPIGLSSHFLPSFSRMCTLLLTALLAGRSTHSCLLSLSSPGVCAPAADTSPQCGPRSNYSSGVCGSILSLFWEPYVCHVQADLFTQQGQRVFIVFNHGA